VVAHAGLRPERRTMESVLRPPTRRPPIPQGMADEPRGAHLARGVSRAGISGINGPYEDAGIVMQRGRTRTGGKACRARILLSVPDRRQVVRLLWKRSYRNLPISSWQVGLASAPDLAGAWVRRTEANPLKVEPRFIENPIVTR